MLAKKADRVLVCFEQAKDILAAGDKIVLTGAPVRGEILAADRAKARAKFGLGGRSAGRFVLGLDGRKIYE